MEYAYMSRFDLDRAELAEIMRELNLDTVYEKQTHGWRALIGKKPFTLKRAAKRGAAEARKRHCDPTVTQVYQTFSKRDRRRLARLLGCNVTVIDQVARGQETRKQSVCEFNAMIKAALERSGLR